MPKYTYLRDRSWFNELYDTAFANKDYNIGSSDPIDERQVNTAIIDWAMSIEENGQTENLLLWDFQETFDGWSEQLFATTDKRLRRAVRDLLRAQGAYLAVGAKETLSRQFSNMLGWKTCPSWPEDELKAAIANDPDFRCMQASKIPAPTRALASVAKTPSRAPVAPTPPSAIVVSVVETTRPTLPPPPPTRALASVAKTPSPRAPSAPTPPKIQFGVDPGGITMGDVCGDNYRSGDRAAIKHGDVDSEELTDRDRHGGKPANNGHILNGNVNNREVDDRDRHGGKPANDGHSQKPDDRDNSGQEGNHDEHGDEPIANNKLTITPIDKLMIAPINKPTIVAPINKPDSEPTVTHRDAVSHGDGTDWG